MTSSRGFAAARLRRARNPVSACSDCRRWPAARMSEQTPRVALAERGLARSVTRQLDQVIA
ncbi:MAG: hypothetical protein ACR2HB_01265 [Dehalococcoidia bacterium]